tara:strand:- start:478 stop:894 length:417 start_codon:yes stop_codon:yes gene_type:complete
MKLTTELLKQLIKEELAESYRGSRRGSRGLINFARTLFLYRPNADRNNPNVRGGFQSFKITRESGEMGPLFFIEDEVDESGKIGSGELQKIQIMPTEGGQRILRMGKVVSTGEKIDLIPDDTSGNVRFGAKSHIVLKP